MPIVRLKDLPINIDGSYLVHHLIPRHDLTVVWGKPKTGKTFWVLDLVMHVAAGLRYRGKAVLQGSVVYCTLEGHWEFGARAHAARRVLGLATVDLPFFCSTDRRIFSKVGGADSLIRDIEKTLSDAPVVVVIDTLNRAIDGSENNDEDMTHFTRCSEAISDAFNCSTIVVHHGGKSSDTPRGHTSLTGTCAAQLKVARTSKITIPGSSMMISTLVEFVKDGPEGEQLFNWIRPVTIQGAQGVIVETCVLEEAPSPESGLDVGFLPPQAKKALSVLEEALTEADDGRIKIHEWKARCELVQLTKSPTSAKQAFWRAVDVLKERNKIQVVDNIWVSLKLP